MCPKRRSSVVVACLFSFFLTKVFNFNVYRPIRALRAGSRRYQYVDHPLPGGTSVLIAYRVIRNLYRAVTVEIRPLLRRTYRISIVTELYQSVCLAIFGLLPPGIFGGFSSFWAYRQYALMYCTDQGSVHYYGSKLRTLFCTVDFTKL